MHGKKLERIIGWAHPILIQRLKYRGSKLFIDGTFRCAPKPFYQCLIVMVHDDATDLFLPVFYVLCTAKTQEIYWHTIHLVIAATDEKLYTETVVCDFEAGLIDAAHVQFSDARVVGCFFHFKQACRRKMKKLGIPEPEISVAMGKDMLDMLTVIPPKKIDRPWIAYANEEIERKCSELAILFSAAKWTKFWVYFRKMWMRMYSPSDWNVHGVAKTLVSRTNNPLECFNRKINECMGISHPSLPRFIGVIDSISRDYVQQLDDIGLQRARKRRRRTPQPFELPTPVDLPSESEENSESEDDDRAGCDSSGSTSESSSEDEEV